MKVIRIFILNKGGAKSNGIHASKSDIYTLEKKSWPVFFPETAGISPQTMGGARGGFGSGHTGLARGGGHPCGIIFISDVGADFPNGAPFG